MKNLFRSLLFFTLIFGQQLLGYSQQSISLSAIEDLGDHPKSVFYGVTEQHVADPHSGMIRFRPISTFEKSFDALPSDRALWRKLAVTAGEDTDFILDFAQTDFADVYIYKDGGLVDHLSTGYLLPGTERQVASANIAHLKLDSGKSYDLYIRTRSLLSTDSEQIKVSTFENWIRDRQTKNLLEIGFTFLLLGVIVYSLIIYWRKRMVAFLYFGGMVSATLLFFGYTSGFLRDLLFAGNPMNVRFLLVSLLVMPYCFYHILNQLITVDKAQFEGKEFIRWTAITNLGLFVVFSLLLINPDNFGMVNQSVKYVLLADALVGSVSIFAMWRNREGDRVYFFIGTVVMMVAVLVGAIFWENSDVVYTILVIASLSYIPLTIYALNVLGAFHPILEEQTFVEELRGNQQMIERQKQDLATQIDELSQKLGGAMQEVEHSAKMKEDFLSIMSHEIRTPLNAIVGLTHLISKEDDIDEIKTNIGTLERSVDALLGLIDDVLDFNRIYTGQLQLENIDFDLHDVVKKIAKTYKLSASQKNIDFEFNFDPLIPIHVAGDSYRLTQVLDNLLSNAIKFTEEGVIRLSARYLNGQKGDKVCVGFEIEDSGIGIAPDDLSKIFDRFQQADTDISRKYGESGLGLSIAKALVSMMGVDFDVKSHPGQGSVFSFTLEFERSGPEDKTTRRMEQIEEGVPQGLRILVVDDNEMNRLILNQFLGKWGIEADDAENGKEAFDKIIKNSYDLVLLDLQMPIMDGYELTRLIRSNEMLRDLPIIAISADSISNVYEKVTAAGMNDFIVKPLNPADLKQKIAVYSHNLQMHSIYSR